MANPLLSDVADAVILVAIALIVSLMVLYVIMIAFATRKQERVVPPKILTKIVCASGNHSEVREFKEGDYVGKEVGKCPKCGSPLLIVAVYSEVQSVKEASARS